jgi:hypothetical protein
LIQTANYINTGNWIIPKPSYQVQETIKQVNTDFKLFWPKNYTNTMTSRTNPEFLKEWLGTRTWHDTNFLAEESTAWATVILVIAIIFVFLPIRQWL